MTTRQTKYTPEDEKKKESLQVATTQTEQYKYRQCGEGRKEYVFSTVKNIIITNSDGADDERCTVYLHDDDARVRTHTNAN